MATATGSSGCQAAAGRNRALPASGCRITTLVRRLVIVTGSPYERQTSQHQLLLTWEVIAMVPLLLVLLLALLLFGAGFALKILWWVAIVVFVIWLVGFVARGAGSSGGRSRWYRW